MNYTQYIAYFRQIAINHKLIGHNPPANKRFFGIDLADLVNSLKNIGETPCLGLEKPYYNTRGSFVNTRQEKTGAIMIFARENDPYNFAGIEAAYNQCYQIAEDVEAKIIKDAKLYDQGKLDYTIPGLDPGRFTIEAMPMGYADGGILGVRLTFVFNEALPLFDADKWNNENNFTI
jgi:hypothetical protein